MNYLRDWDTMDKTLLRTYLHDLTESAVSDDILDQLIGQNPDDFNAVVSGGWRIKAGTVSDWYDASIDGRVLSRDQVFKHCIKMAELYSSEAGANIKSTRIEVTPPAEAEAEMV